MVERTHIRPEGMSNAPTYSHGVSAGAGTTVYISGQIAVDADGRTVGVGDLAAQTDQVMKNLGTVLEAAGATFADVVKITTFVVDYEPAHRPIIAEVRGRYLPVDNPPASTLLGVTALAAPDYLIEIEATAVI
jgi:enamine deaminase RidA (YjgF/YER057c/UK114 family)